MKPSDNNQCAHNLLTHCLVQEIVKFTNMRTHSIDIDNKLELCLFFKCSHYTERESVCFGCLIRPSILVLRANLHICNDVVKCVRGKEITFNGSNVMLLKRVTH